MKLPNKDEFNSIIGLTEADAKAALNKIGVGHIRIREKNGEHFMVTMDFRMDRVNLHIKDDLVYKASRG